MLASPEMKIDVKRFAPWVPLTLATALLARKAIGAILTKLGHPGATLDDAYIHFQYARAIAEGHPFRYQAGQPISSGATSFLWPLLLAPFHLVGFRGESILWPAWILSFSALGALAYEAYALTKPLTSRAAAIGAGAMTLLFGGFIWCAASGMEVVPFAWVIAHLSRRAAEWVEAKEEERTPRALRILIAFALAAPLLRPEGALTSLAAGACVALHPRAASDEKKKLLRRAEGLAFVATALAPSLLLLALTGTMTSSTAQVKLLFGNPYYVLPDAAIANAKLLLGTLLDGEVWSAEFLPKGGSPIACAGLAAIVWCGKKSNRPWRAGLALLLALMMFVPCLYVTFLWNRLRYLWPFATGWFIGLACLAHAAASLVAYIDRRVATVTSALVAGAFAGALFVRLEWVVEDVAQSASGIDRQQVALGKWANQNLPPDAVIGVNDTGAIAYFGNRKTFDVVGLTTPGEGRYWVAGSASRLEHYERLHEKTPKALPTHFIVYPEWMGCEPLLGRALHEAVVTDASILGGQVMRVSVARWELLKTGEKPWTPLSAIVDTLDVADLESEASHAFELFGAREGEQTTHEGNAENGGVVLDGGRTNRTRDRFTVKLPAGDPIVGIMRVESTAGGDVTVRIDGQEVAKLSIEPGPWVELTFDVPPEMRGDKMIEVNAKDSTFTSYHYWFGAKAGSSRLPTPD